MKSPIALTLALANAGLLHALNVQPEFHAGAPHGTIALANDSLFDQANLQVELTTHGIGYADPNRNRLAQLREFIAPTRSGGRNIKITQWNEHEPFEVVDPAKVKRAEMGDFHTVKQRSSTKVDRQVPNRGLTVVLDNDQLVDKPNWKQMHTEWLIDLLTRASLLEAFALYDTFALTADAIWDSLANPDLDIKSSNISVLAAATGFKANRACYGEGATLQRQIAYESQDNAGAFARAALMSDQQIATAIGVDRVMTNIERYNAAANAKDLFLNMAVLLFSAQDGESMEDISNVVRHVANTVGGGAYAVYIEERLKKTIVTVENYELFAVQHTSGCAKINVTGV